MIILSTESLELLRLVPSIRSLLHGATSSGNEEQQLSFIEVLVRTDSFTHRFIDRPDDSRR